MLSFLVSFDFRLAALFLWIIERLAFLSINETIFGSCSVALSFSSRFLNSFTAFLIVLAKYLFLMRLVWSDLIRFNADLWFAITYLIYNSLRAFKILGLQK